MKWSESRSAMSDFLWQHGLYSPWNSLGQNTGVGSLSLLQGIFLTQGLNPGLPHCRRILYQLNHNIGQLGSVIQSYPTLCEPMDCSTPGLLVHHQLPEPTQTHVHWVGDVIQSSHPLMPPSLTALNPSQHQSFPMSQLFASGSQCIGVSASISVFPLYIQDWLPLGCTSWISLQSKWLSRVFSSTTVQKHQFFGTQLSL